MRCSALLVTGMCNVPVQDEINMSSQGDYSERSGYHLRWWDHAVGGTAGCLLSDQEDVLAFRMLSPLLSDLISGHSARGHPGPHEVNLFVVFQCFYQYLYFCSLTTINR